ncbi:MAG: cytochrome c3 family protein [Desulfatibacillaceae bacterium]
MDKKTNRVVAYAMVGVFFLVGLVGYIAFPYEQPTEPVRILFPVTAGNVVFDHLTHAEDFTSDCASCHHHYPGVQEDYLGRLAGCGECHVSREWDDPHPQLCVDCHQEMMIEDYLEGAEYPNPYDAAHSDYSFKSCVGCHEDVGAGPGAGAENCGGCHVL